MSIKIGHAKVSENGTNAGKAGDQTGKEVFTEKWYARTSGQEWKVLRHPDPVIRERIARFVEYFCKGNLVGYDRGSETSSLSEGRNSLHRQLLQNHYDIEKVTKCEADCSSFITAAAIWAGVKELEYGATKNAPVTATMEKAYMAAGFECISGQQVAKTDRNLLRGDILFCAGHHTMCALEDGAGNRFPTLKVGNVCKHVSIWRVILGTPGSSEYTTSMKKDVKEWQKAHGLEADGIIGPLTWEAGISSLKG